MHEHAKAVYDEYWTVASPNRQSDTYMLSMTCKRIGLYPKREDLRRADKLAAKLITNPVRGSVSKSVNGTYSVRYTGTGFTDLAYAREGVVPFEDLEPGVYMSAVHHVETHQAIIFQLNERGEWSSTFFIGSHDELADYAKIIYDKNSFVKLVKEQPCEH